ncbi:hypothetical protein Tco_1472983, partial [Tanacetum coccineum]
MRYFTGLTILAFTHSSTSLVTTLLFSVPKTLCFCAIGGMKLLTFSACRISYLGTPAISDGFHANTSMLLFRRRINCSQHLVENQVPIVIACSGNARLTNIFSSHLGSESCLVTFLSDHLHSYTGSARAHKVAIPFGVGNFNMACTVDDTALSSCKPMRPIVLQRSPPALFESGSNEI